jgi:uncharacterized membrane protein
MMRKLNLVLILGLFLFSCGRIINSSSSDEATYSPRAAGSPQHEAALAIISAKCAECHGEWLTKSDAQFVSDGLIVPQNPTASLIYYRNQLGPGPNNNMPTGGRSAMTSAELQTISDWINAVN